jgi:hypothetical protein
VERGNAPGNANAHTATKRQNISDPPGVVANVEKLAGGVVNPIKRNDVNIIY